MEGFLLEFKEMKDSITKLKDNLEEVTEELRGLKDLTSQQNDEISHLKKENEVLRDRIENLQNKEKHVEGGDMSQSSAACDDLITKVDLKYDKKVTALQEMSAEMQNEIFKFHRLQKVLNSLHFTLQTRKELGEEVDKLKTEVSNLKDLNQPGAEQNTEINTAEGKKILTFLASPPPKLKSGQHPSKRAMSMTEAQRWHAIRQENIKRSTFSVFLANASMEKDVDVWIGNYTDVRQPCDFMDPISGVYTVPLQGDYEFTVFRRNLTDSLDLFLCTDKDDKKQKIPFYDYYDKCWTNTLSLKCDMNEKVWVEALGKNRDNYVTNLKFSGRMS